MSTHLNLLSSFLLVRTFDSRQIINITSTVLRRQVSIQIQTSKFTVSAEIVTRHTLICSMVSVIESSAAGFQTCHRSVRQQLHIKLMLYEWNEALLPALQTALATRCLLGVLEGGLSLR